MTGAQGSAFIRSGTTGPFLKANHIWIHKQLPTGYITFFNKSKTNTLEKKDGLFWSPKSGILGVRTSVSAQTSDYYSPVDRRIKHQRPLWTVLLLCIPEVCCGWVNTGWIRGASSVSYERTETESCRTCFSVVCQLSQRTKWLSFLFQMKIDYSIRVVGTLSWLAAVNIHLLHRTI